MKKLVLTLLFFPFFLTSQNLDVADGASFTVGTGGTATISGTITSNTSGSIIIQTSQANSGSLIAKDGGGSQGKGITLARQLDNGEWTLIGVPVSNQSVDATMQGKLISGSGSQSGKFSIGLFNPATGDGEFEYLDGGTNLTKGKGYGISPNGAQTIDFTGTMAVSDWVVDLVDESGTYGNWNLIGNPFPSYLHMTDDGGDATNNFLTVNASALDNSYVAVYAWDGAAYDIYDQSSNSINHIAPGEGFFVYAKAGAATNITFTEAMQTSGKGANFNASLVENPFQRESIVKIQMKDQNNDELDYIRLIFSDQSTRGLDPGYDVGKFFMGSESKVFTRLIEEDKGVNFHNQALPYIDLKDLVVPLGFTTKSSSLQLSIKENSIDHLYNIYLEDRLNNTIVEFDKSIDLNFDDNVDGLGRFFLHFTDGVIPELPTDEDFRIFKVSNNELRLMGSHDTSYKAKVYDFSGRLVKEVDFIHRVNINDIDTRGISILKIEGKNKPITKKFKIR